MQTQNERVPPQKWVKKGGAFVLCIYLLALFYATLFIYNYYPYGKSVNLVLFDSIKLMWESGSYWLILKNIIGNILLFMPLGFLIPLVSKKGNSGLIIAIIGFATSTLIELLQYFVAQRIFDIDDILLNALGAVVGYVAFRVVLNLYRKMKKVK
ncbi:VanZ family protein [Pseudalkalibacillus hwajinpoensis]|uniref:VanZ family protein n=1 Tax=Guptibacillus hwajinpoensis TaxID=208199 RepID=A0A4U1MDU6_9BACL|nr:VanZ family protein [Pseudalkalibacillus hwajinpoensis]TKD68320.1 VanZ family protein [Pseudalkalibacillus hwajinpoensis]